MATELDGPPFPALLGYLWSIFAELQYGLDSGGWGTSVVTWQTLDAWSRLGGIALSAREAVALVRLGAVRAEVMDRPKG